ncbi:LamG domain-containing protein [Seonamhaeicola marinus]|uniref:LamG domain-containing protein n=1 Tax=Seonamhaeicola marinus TaxID=1912246 RepID=A0A5D0HFU7_9FLAO|nr:LamG domain-containing protein [Seonamhaeicola marinus]TYA70181.1 LamG domain-containing protein [Seonamhaeicola marinus]
MKTKVCFLITFLVVNFVVSQNSDVQITVRWLDNSYENKVEIYNTANDLIATICDDNQCYVSSQQGVTDRYGSKFDLGCVTNGNNYYVKLYDIANDGWQGTSYISVVVAGVEVINNDGSGANTSGQTIFFNVSGGDATCNALLDTDEDGIVDYLDYDDDGDGLTDGTENLGENRFECSLPELAFENGAYDAAASSGAVDTVGAVYRFSNSINGHDVLMEIIELTDATINNIDNDTVDNPTYLQTELGLTGSGTPGATFKFTIVNAGTTTPSTTIFRINGITWDCDGSGGLKESVVYHDVAAYGIENPSSLEIQDLGGGDIQISASGLQEGPGFSTLKVLRAYYQFIGNSFTMRMQGIKTYVGGGNRQFGMSFTQCEFLDFNANSLNIVQGEDFDGDGRFNHLDIDSDSDGIPDNVEAQPTLSYILPTGNVGVTGIDTAYGTGIYPEDTDRDKIPDFIDTNSDNDQYTDIQENGMADTYTAADVDDDGLNDAFETNGVNDTAWDVNEDIEDPTDLSILPDADADLNSGGDLDYRDVFSPNPPVSATLDFDGVDDYVESGLDLSNYGQLTTMAWVRLDAGFSSTGTVLSQGDFKIKINSSRVPVISLNGEVVTLPSSQALTNGIWAHLTTVFDVSASSNRLKIYINGHYAATCDDSALNSSISASTDAFTIGKDAASDSDYFNGDIDEVRVFDVALTEYQLQKIIYQEIQEASNVVTGSVIPKPVVDDVTSSSISWSNLVAYYPMTDIKNGYTTDYSNNSNTAYFYNITTVMDQTAPMPYETSGNGNFSSSSSWVHGDHWDLNLFSAPNCGIVKVSHDVSLNSSLNTMGLIIDDGGTLTINGNNLVQNSWYFELNGTLDLMNDSQLIQTNKSDLVTSANGKALRRQEGTPNIYWYNYWSSPVGATGATTLIDNNASTNNANNSPFTISMIKDGTGADCLFTSGYDGNGSISTYWLYSYKNGRTYWDWVRLTTSSAIEPGVGYTQKGTGVASSEQQYIFEGKPNNGTILIDVLDVGGPGSEGNVSRTSYLLGNPYPSALDVHQFIDDNAGVIGGDLYLWQQWSGSSHNLREYEGGYAQVNKSGAVRAYQFVPLSGGGHDETKQNGTLIPTRYLPIGQGFSTEIIADGTVEFNNSQRVFALEDDADGDYENGSVFFKNTKSNSKGQAVAKTTEEELNPFKRLRLEFNTVSGPATRRELLLGFSTETSDAFDYGYDAECHELNNNDLNLSFEDKNMNIQAFGDITDDKVVPLNFKSSGDNTFEIRLTQIENVDESQEIYIKDNLTGEYFDLRNNEAYGFSATQGKFNERFEIVFQSQQQSLSVEDALTEENHMYYLKSDGKLYVKKLKSQVVKMAVVSVTGQIIFEVYGIPNAVLEGGVDLPKVASGAYVAYLRTEDNQVISKKIMIH